MNVSQILSRAMSRSKNTFAVILIAYIGIVLVLRTLLGDQKSMASVSSAGTDVSENASRLADIMAYNLISLAFALYCGRLGVLAWYGEAAAETTGSAMHRMYCHSPAVEWLCVVTTAYELYNCISTALYPEYRTVAFIGHHVTTLTLGVLTFHPWCHYYSIFFFGVATVSSVPLCLGEILDSCGVTGLAVAVTKGVFALLFLAIRTCYWPYVSYGFWRDCLYALSDRKARVHSVGAYALLLSANIGLTGLQFMWTSQILTAIHAVVAA